MNKILTAEWWRDLGDMLNANQEFRSAAKNFTFDCLFVADDSRKSLVRFKNGDCFDVHPATPEEFKTADFVISSTPETWEKVVRGTASARLSVLKGKIKLERGSMAAMLKHLGSAGLIFDTMKVMPTIFDDGSTQG